MKWIFDDVLAVEDMLQETGCFKNMITGKTCHSDSYGTLVDFDNFQNAKEQILNYMMERQPVNFDYWLDNDNTPATIRMCITLLKLELDKSSGVT